MDTQGTALLQAALDGRLDHIARLLDDAVDASVVHPRLGRSALHWLCGRGGADGFPWTRPDLVELTSIVRRLVAAGAPIDARDSRGNTALLYESDGSQTRDAGLVPVLLELRAHPNLRCQHGRTALHVAARRQAPARVKALIEGGAAADLRDDTGWTAAMVASRENDAAASLLASTLDPADEALIAAFAAATDPVAVRGALDGGLDVNVRDWQGRTLLMLAAANGADEAAQLLLDRGADKTLVDISGSTAMGHANMWLDWNRGGGSRIAAIVAL